MSFHLYYTDYIGIFQHNSVFHSLILPIIFVYTVIKRGEQYMDDKFIRERISVLRTKKGISEYKMSLDLGHSKSYIQSISSGKALPSMSEFLSICDYLQITPRDFFDLEEKEPILIQELLNSAGTLTSDDLALLIELAKRLAKK